MNANSSVFFQLRAQIRWTKIVHPSETFELFSGWVKVHKISHVLFETTSQFFLNFALIFNVIRDISSSVLF